MLLTAIFPEFVVCCAISQLQQARDLDKAWKASWPKEGEEREWLGMSGAFFVVMGGYVITGKTKASDGSTESLPSEPAESVLTLTPEGLKWLLRNGRLQGWISDGILNKSDFHFRTIEDKGKANNIAKALVSLQILWVVVQCIGRKSTGLPVTLLEAHVLIQIVYSIAAYFCWWSKPLDVAVPLSLPIADNLATATDQDWQLNPGTSSPDIDVLPSRHAQLARRRKVCKTLASVLYRASYDFGWNLGHRAQLWSAGMGVANGALHATASLSHFPTPVERWLWRAACVGVAVSPVATDVLVRGKDLESYGLRYLRRLATKDTFSVSECLGEYFVAWSEAVGSVPWGGPDGPRGFSAQVPRWARHAVIAAVASVTAVYTLSILFLTVEAFISMRSLPGGAYKTVVWANVLPHF
ncbi:hypothetical protein B0T25DRAFT_457434 [Lasiosphaeria hispida]|uniref:Uncharacterized protein n=1 Tax=Lasiosphaeria hispida TaxID=260671 RepID=A0AAJ0HCZ9_9PEZI|nr:hypothetical protein B0T25DRAFT_457434 [Lasiosphaeria hispida]